MRQQDRHDVSNYGGDIKVTETCLWRGELEREVLHFNIIQVAIMLVYYFHKNKRKCLRNCLCFSASKHEIQSHLYLYHRFVKRLPYQDITFSLKALKKKKSQEARIFESCP